MSKVADNIDMVRQRIAAAAKRAGRDPSTVAMLAVTKTATIEQVKEALEAGVTDLAENRVQEALKKNSCLSALSGIKWHMIGHLQTNKVRQAVELFEDIHSVDTLKLAQEIGRRAAELNKPVPVFVEVNVSGEPTKFGTAKNDARMMVESIMKVNGIKVLGLMTMAPYNADPEASRAYFRQLKELADGLGLKGLSMGMSGDFEVAVEEGATAVRIGTAIFER